MPTSWPAAVDSQLTIPSVINNLTPVNALTIENLRGAIIAIENNLGVGIAGTYGTVAARLAAIEAAEGSGGGTIILGGDLAPGAVSNTQKVIGIQGNPVSPNAPALNQTLIWNGTVWAPSSSSSLPSGPASNDLSGSYPGPSVVRLSGATIPAAGSLTTGNVLQVNGSSSLTYGPVNLAGGSNYVIGTLPSGNIPNLAGDITGPISSTNVSKLQGYTLNLTGTTDGYSITYKASSNSYVPEPKIVLGVPNLAALRATIGSLNNTATMGGYYAIGDGGGGDFYWDTSSSTGDDGATIIVPTGSTTGRWRRIFDGCTINVLWFGAVGDGTTDDTAAIQNALNWGPGTFSVNVNFPARTFVLTAPVNNVALYITKAVNMIGTPGTSGGQTQGTCFAINGSLPDGYTAGSGLLFEINFAASPPTSANGSVVSNFFFTSHAGNPPRNTIICHTTVDFYNCYFENACTLSSIQYDSGDVQAQWGQTFTQSACLCYSRMPVNTYALCDNPTVTNCTFYESPNYNYIDTTTTESFVQQGFNIPFNLTVADATQLIGSIFFLITLPVGTQRNICGVYQLNSIINNTTINCSAYYTNDGNETPIGTTIPNGAQISCGKAFYPHGADAGIGVFTNLSALLSPISFCEGGQVTNTWIQCYSQASRLGFFVYSASYQPIFIHPGSEDFVNSMITVPGAGALVVGNTMDARELGGYIESIGNGEAFLAFERINTLGDGYKYGAQIPDVNQQSPLSMIIEDTLGNNLQFSYAYNTAFDTLPYHQHSLIMNSDDSSGGAWGCTSGIHPRGKFLSMFCSPTINTQRHWKWKQAVMLNPGSNIVYINGGNVDAGYFVFCENGTDVWSLAQSAVDIAIEYGDISDLENNQCYVAGYTFITETTYNRNIACNVINMTSNVVAVNLVWSFDMFVTNYNSNIDGTIG